MKMKLAKCIQTTNVNKGDEIYFSGMTKSASCLTMSVNKYAGKFPMASFNMKTWWALCVITKNLGLKKYAIVLANTLAQSSKRSP